MEEFVARYRNASLLVAVLFVQFVLLGYQVKTGEDVRLVRVWTTALISPVEKLLGNGTGVFGSLWNEYVWLRGTRAENETLEAENERLKLETQQLRRALARFSREEEVLAYQQEILSETVLAQVTGVGSNPNAREVTVDKGRRDGIKPGMAVITADGVVGKVQAAHGSYSLVLLMNDADSGVGALLKNSRARGVLKGTGRVEGRLEYIDAKVEIAIGETVYTSGEDRVFPRGLPVGEVTRVGAVSDYQEIYVRPYAALNRLDEVLVVTAGVHEDLPRFVTPQPPEVMMPMPPGVPDTVSSNGLGDRIGTASNDESSETAGDQAPSGELPSLTEADALLERYRALGAAQQHRYGEGDLQTPPPDFNLGLPSAAALRPPQSDQASRGTASPSPTVSNQLPGNQPQGNELPGNQPENAIEGGGERAVENIRPDPEGDANAADRNP